MKDELRLLTELDEKARAGGEFDLYTFQVAAGNWWRTGGRELAEDGLRYRVQREAAYLSHTKEQHAVLNEAMERASFYKAYDQNLDDYAARAKAQQK